MLGKPKHEEASPVDMADFLCGHYRLSREKLSGCKDVFAALRLDGDDCFDFMTEFSEFFGVDLAAYDWSKFHHSEGEEMDPLGLFRAVRWVFGRQLEPKRSRPIFPISANHLMKVASDKRWSDPDPMPSPRTKRVGRFGFLFGPAKSF